MVGISLRQTIPPMLLNHPHWLLIQLETPQFSYLDSSSQDLKFARFNGFSWEVTTIDTVGSVGWDSSLAFGADGHPAISYYDDTNENLKFARFNGLSWSVRTVDSAGDVGKESSLAFDSDGFPSIAYLDESVNRLKFAKVTSYTLGLPNWNITTVIGAGGIGDGISLAYNSDGEPTIACYSHSFVGLVYGRFDGTSWDFDEVDDGGSSIGEISLVFNPDGHPAISHHSGDGNALKFTLFDGSAWATAIVDTGDLHFSNSLAYDSSGRPTISYVINDQITLATWNGHFWTQKVVNESGERPSLAIDPDGKPAVAHDDVLPGSSTRVVRFARLGVGE